MAPCPFFAVSAYTVTPTWRVHSLPSPPFTGQQVRARHRSYSDGWEPSSFEGDSQIVHPSGIWPSPSWPKASQVLLPSSALSLLCSLGVLPVCLALTPTVSLLELIAGRRAFLPSSLLGRGSCLWRPSCAHWVCCGEVPVDSVVKELDLIRRVDLMRWVRFERKRRGLGSWERAVPRSWDWI